MSFRRTAVGLSNLHLFLKVDAVVYTEGGQESFGLNDVIVDKFNAQAIDTLFWRGLFEIFASTKKVAFRAIGSKTTLVEIATDLSLGKVTNVYVALDRDHDNYKGSLNIAPGILHTYGYSWENDVWQVEVIEGLFYLLSQTDPATTKIINEINLLIAELKRDLHWVIYIDILMSRHNMAFMPRGRDQRLIKFDSGKRPSIDRNVVHSLCQGIRIKKSASVSLGKRISINSLLDCYGHFYASFCHKILLYLLQNFGVKSISQEFLQPFAIQLFLTKLKEGKFSGHQKYYEIQFALI